jgi:Mg-chelatase subunit ChlD
MAMPDGWGSTRKDRSPQDSGGGRRRVVAFFVVALGVTVPVLATDRVLSWWGWVLLGVGGVVGGIVGIHAMDDALAVFLDQLGRRWNQPGFRSRLRAPLLWTLVAVVSLPAGMGLAGFVGWVRYVTGECPVTVPARVLTTPVMSGTVERLATAFQTSTADSRGCRRYSVFVMTLSDGDARTALSGGWRDGTDPKSSDVARFGPRPDAYLPDSLLALAELGKARSRVVQDALVYASAQVVLALTPTAVPNARTEKLPGSNLRKQIAELRTAQVPVVRPAPELSQAGVIAHSAYRQDAGDRSPSKDSPDFEESKRFEESMLEDAQKAKYPDGGEKALLERLSDSGPTRQSVALLMTAPFARHPELLLGAGRNIQLDTYPLSASEGQEPSDVSLPFLTLSFETGAGQSGDRSRCEASNPAERPSACAAWEFRNWLGTEDGRRKLMELDLTPCTDSSCAHDPRTGDEREGTVLTTTKYARQVHEAARAPRRVLVAMDASGSMGPRFQKVAGTIGSDLPRLLSARDQLGLELIGGSSSSGKAQRQFPLGPVGDRQDTSKTVADLRSALTDWQSGGGSPMADPLGQALKDLASSSPPSPQGVMLLVTDGSFARHLEDAKRQVKQLMDQAKKSRVRVLALVAGASTCPEELQRIVDASSGLCDPVQGSVTGELDKLMGGQ